jgi:septal ring factor EnvC (AmiA/AmiB activator)
MRECAPPTDPFAVRTGRLFRLAVLSFLIASFCLAPPAAAASPTSLDGRVTQLGAIRQQCVAAALAVQQRESAIGALNAAMGVMESAADAKNREIAADRQQQEALLGALERLARAPPEALVFAPGGPVNRLRGGILIAAVVPALSTETRELGEQSAALAAARKQIAAHRAEIDVAHAALAKEHDALAELVARRDALVGQLPHDTASPGETAKIGDQASDILDLIKRADAATDQHEKELLAHLRVSDAAPGKSAPPLSVDPTRPKSLRALDAPQSVMVWPVSGEPVHRFGEAGRDGRPSQGLTLQAVPLGIVVAPFDGRVDFAGPFLGYGLILIIRHAGGYHSLLAGLGHVDVTMGQWLLAGEPVGSLPDADDKGASATFYFELRRDGRPLDPQSRLESRDQTTEDARVRE